MIPVSLKKRLFGLFDSSLALVAAIFLSMISIELIDSTCEEEVVVAWRSTIAMMIIIADIELI